MLKTNLYRTRIVCAPQVLDALMGILRWRVPLELQNTRITEDDIWYVLSYAAAHRTTIESACVELEDAPSGNRFREVLRAALPDRMTLQRELNTALRAQLPRSLLKGKRSYALAGDLTLIPYHGQADQDNKEIVRGEAKSGTSHFHGYATISIVHNKRRYVLALTFVEQGERMVSILRRLLNRVKRLKIKVRRVYLDKGFCAVEVFKTLDRRDMSYIIPIPVRGKSGGVRHLFHGHTSYFAPYTFDSPASGQYTVQAAAVRRYTKGKYGRQGVVWFAYAVSGLSRGYTPKHVFELYRQRFGIETSYRQMNQVRARTTSRNPVVRLLLVGLAFIFVNLYVALRDRLTTRKSKTLVSVRFWCSLARLAWLLGRAIEKKLSVAVVIQYRSVPMLS